jgi:hypothetical protein
MKEAGRLESNPIGTRREKIKYLEEKTQRSRKITALGGGRVVSPNFPYISVS